jgi:hypothetical protein
MLFGLFFVLAINAVGSFGFILTQRGFSRLRDARHHWNGLHHVGFIRSYDFGHWVGFDRLALAIRQSTTPNDKIIGPDASVLTFLSDRQVYAPIIGTKTKIAGQLFHLAIFSAEEDWHQSKRDYDQMLKKFLRTLHKQQGAVIAGPEANLKLAELSPIPAHRLTKAERIEHARRMAAKRKRAARTTAPSHP